MTITVPSVVYLALDEQEAESTLPFYLRTTLNGSGDIQFKVWGLVEARDFINLGPCEVAGEVERQRTLIIVPHGERPEVTELKQKKAMYSKRQREKGKKKGEHVRCMDFFFNSIAWSDWFLIFFFSLLKNPQGF